MRIDRHPAILLALLVALPAPAADWLYLTQPGDTLISIGQHYLANPKDWPKIQSANSVAIPRHLPVNSRLKIPVSLLKTAPAPVTVMAVGGNVRVKTPGGPFQALVAGALLHGGETVLTGPGGSAAFRFADDTLLTQQASSKLSFGRLAVYGKTGMIATEISLDHGRMEATAATQQAPAGGFNIKTPVAVAGLRGTVFRLNVAEDGQRMSNEVLEGAVALGAQGQEVTVAAGFGATTEAGKPPESPRALSARPDLSALPVHVRTLPLAFSWPPGAPASAWRAQVAADARFQTILREALINAPSVHWNDDLPDGPYVLRVRAVDAFGLEGFDALHAFTLDARPLPPALVRPIQDERQYQTLVGFTWASVAEARGYLLQLSRTPDFSGEVHEQRLPEVLQHQIVLMPGAWHWRMASLNQQGEPRAFSPVRRLRVHPLPSPPGGGSSKAAPGQASFAWNAQEGVARYGFELSNASGSIVLERNVETPALSLASLKPGRYSWRVRSLEADGKAGAWGADTRLILPPPPPRPDAPPEGLRLLHPEVALSWSPAEGALAYRLQISDRPDFSRPRTEVRLTTTAFIWKVPAVGVWHWRIAALGESNAGSGYATGRSFRYLPPPAQIEALSLTLEEKALRATWSGQAAHYLVEFARDGAFTQILSTQKVNTGQASVPKPEPGDYWVRVTPFDTEDVAGPVSEPARIEIKQPFWYLLLPAILLL